jgi:hypothetical protein
LSASLGRLATTLVAVLGVVAACGQQPATGTIGETAAPPTSPDSVAPATPLLPTASVAVQSPVTVDDRLLLLLPSEVAGVPLNADPETAAQIAADASLAGSIASVAVATAFGPMATDTTSDYVVVTLNRLAPGVFDEAFFRDWRTSFDEAVCDQAGGVARHAEAAIEGHQTFIGSCAGGVRTYHTYLPASGVILSMQALGDGRFGERVVAGLTE